jgi:enamine deaminase RidA (YjgF/YER057c/UK114 family)
MFQHLRSVIEAAGGTTDDIIKLTVWMADRSEREAVNREWLAMFPNPENRPARQTLQAELGGGIRVQCDFLAVIGDR